MKCTQQREVPVISIADHVQSVGEYSIGSGILELLKRYNCAPHLIFSLMSGRPVIVQGPCSKEKLVRDTVKALWIFVPGHCSNSVVVSSTSVPSIADLQTVRLYGLIRTGDKKSSDSPIPCNVECHASVFDLEKNTLLCPPYQGTVVTEIFSMRNVYTNDGAFIAFIHSKLFELTMKAYLYFHGFSLRKSASLADEIELLSQREEWEATSRTLCSKLKLKEDDALIIKYLVDIIKSQQTLEMNNYCRSETDSMTSSLLLDHRKCQLFSLST
jgi:hypothetical protein